MDAPLRTIDLHGSGQGDAGLVAVADGGLTREWGGLAGDRQLAVDMQPTIVSRRYISSDEGDELQPACHRAGVTRPPAHPRRHLCAGGLKPPRLKPWVKSDRRSVAVTGESGRF